MDDSERFLQTIDEHTREVTEAGTLHPLLSILEPAWDRDWFILIGPDQVLRLMNGSVPDSEFRYLYRPPARAGATKGEATAFGALVHWNEAARAVLSGEHDSAESPLKDSPIMVALRQVEDEQLQAYVADDSPENRQKVSAMLRDASEESD